MKKYAIIVAGGTGSRMKGYVPKQFMMLKGKPVILYSMEAFYTYDADMQIIVVVHPDFIGYWKQICEGMKVTIPHTIISGGLTRFHSVKNGLNTITEDGHVAIHDAARPLITAGFIERLFSVATEFGCAIPVVTLNDTVRIIEENSSRQLDRNLLKAVQTPQVFGVSNLKKAYKQEISSLFTDDASVFESAGFTIHLTTGHYGNIKITLPEDISMAEVFLKTV
jgi:2-C-methyl-D-erythritol 4-phosphate cytidylyltransferase